MLILTSFFFRISVLSTVCHLVCSYHALSKLISWTMVSVFCAAVKNRFCCCVVWLSYTLLVFRCESRRPWWFRIGKFFLQINSAALLWAAADSHVYHRVSLQFLFLLDFLYMITKSIFVALLCVFCVLSIWFVLRRGGVMCGPFFFPLAPLFLPNIRYGFISLKQCWLVLWLHWRGEINHETSASWWIGLCMFQLLIE